MNVRTKLPMLTPTQLSSGIYRRAQRSGDLSVPAPAACMNRLRQFYPWQRLMWDYAKNRDRIALFVDMRLMKTLVAIRWVKYHNAFPSIIICPDSAIAGWEDDIRREGISDDYVAKLYTKNRSQLAEELRKVIHGPLMYAIINKEAPRVFESIATMIKWRSVLADEAHFLKNPKAKITQYMLKQFRDVPYRAVLTGTPNTESDLEYFCQLQFLDPRILPDVNNYYEFRAKYFSLPVNAPKSFKWFLTTRGKRKLVAALNHHCLFMTKEDAGLPEKLRWQVRKVKMPDSVRKIYQKAEKDFILDLGGDTEKLMTKWAMQKFLWLRRISSGWFDGRQIWAGKARALLDIVHCELNKEKVVIWCDYIDEIEHLSKMVMRSAVIYGAVSKTKRKLIRNSFQGLRGPRRLIAQPKTLEEGSRLDAAGTAIYYSSPLGLKTRLQTERRIVHMGSSENKYILDLVVEDSIDEDILKSHQNKMRRVDSLRMLMKSMKDRI